MARAGGQGDAARPSVASILPVRVQWSAADAVAHTRERRQRTTDVPRWTLHRRRERSRLRGTCQASTGTADGTEWLVVEVLPARPVLLGGLSHPHGFAAFVFGSDP